MKEMDIIEVTVEKEEYAKEGVHKGMQGWICCDRCLEGYWLVDFPRYGEKSDVADIGIHENDMKQIPRMDVRTNERIFDLYGTELMPED